MKLRSIVYRSFHHGNLGIEVQAGGSQGPLALSVKELLNVVLYFRSRQDVSVLSILDDVQTEEADRELSELTPLVKDAGIAVAIESDGQRYPPWIHHATLRTMHISSALWLQIPCSEIVYHLDERASPVIDTSHLNRNTSLYVQAENPKQAAEAIKFVNERRAGLYRWRLRIPPRFSVSTDLAEFDLRKLLKE